GDNLENQLKLVGVELSDFPDNVNLQLEKGVRLQRETQLHELSLNFLQEFYYVKKREDIEHRLTLSQQSRELDKLQRTLEATDRDLCKLKSFNEAVEKSLMPEAMLERSIADIEATTCSLLETQKNFKVPKDFNLESLIDKVEALESR
ncbi:hypothetical protein KR222_002049, partial [Zaprionus bogoriensis]